MGYFAVKLGGIDRFINQLLDIFRSDSSHDYLTKWRHSVSDGIFGLLWIVAAMAVSALLNRIGNRRAQKKRNYFSVLGLVLLFSEIILLIFMSENGINWKYVYTMAFPVSMLIGIDKFKYLEDAEKEICILGYLVSISSFVAVSLLTNMGLLTMLSYLIVGAMFSFIPIWKWCMQGAHCDRGKEPLPVFLVCICLLTIFHRGMAVMGYSAEKGTGLVYDIENIIRCGPSRGIVASVEICDRTRADWEEWPQYMGEGDSCLAVGGWLIDSSVYLNGKAKISNYSMIDTTTYDVSLLRYWEMNPEKKPTVIAVSGYEGSLEVQEDSWIMTWIEGNYDWVGNGTFWVFYRNK